MRRIFRTLVASRRSAKLADARPAPVQLRRPPRLCALEDRTTPVTAILNAANVVATGGTTYNFDVVYTDLNGIDLTSIDNTDVAVSGGNGAPITINPGPNLNGATGTPTDVTVTYTFNVPGGQWNLTNRGLYGVDWKAGSVSDQFATPFPAADETLGGFAVAFRDVNGKFEVSEASSNFEFDWSTGKVSLEEAVFMSNVVAGADTIDFSTTTFNTAQTINLSYDPTVPPPNGTLSDNFIAEDLVINGPGSAKLTLNAEDSTLTRRDRRFFWIDPGMSSTITVNISGLTLVNADVGFNTQGQSFINSPVYAHNTNLTLSDMTFSKNTAGFGGAVFMDAGSTLSATSCTFDQNWSIWDNATGSILGGGAISTQSDGVDITLTNCTFSSNSVDNITTTGGGGAISFFGDGKLTINGGSFTNNSADGRGGAIVVGADGEYGISSVTFNGNNVGEMGGAIYTQSSATTAVRTLSDCTFAGNYAIDRGGAIATFDPQQLTVTNCTFSNNSALSTFGGAVYGQGGVTTDVRTFTGCTFNDNFSASVGGAICDFSPDPLKVTNSSFTNNTASTERGGAIYVQGSDTINIATREITGSTFTGNSSADAGGAVNFTDNINVTITGSTFTGNVAQQQGGAISFNDVLDQLGAVRNISSCTFNGNISNNRGGAISDFDPDQLTINNCTFTANTAAVNYGGALYLQGGDATVGFGQRNISNSTFSNNSAASVGGAIAELSGNSIDMKGTSIIGNTAGANGGGIYLQAGTTATVRTFTDVLIDNNVGTHGGGLYTTGDSQLTFTRSRFSANTSTAVSGGGLALNGLSAGSAVTIDSCLFVGNKVTTSGYSGGGIGLATSTTPFAAPVTITNTTITGNSSATHGGAIRGFGNFTGVLTIQNSTVAGNTSVGNGAINMNNANTVIRSTIISDNVAASNADMTGTYASVTYSLVKTKGTSTWTVNSNNITGVSAQLNPLANNGGPLQTMTLKSSSPAIDQGINPGGVILLDARGATRTQDDPGVVNAIGGDGTDIGAVENIPAVAPPPTITSIKIDTGTGQRSLIRSIVVTFSENIDFVSTPAAAFDLQRLVASVSPGPTGAVTLAFLPVTGPTSSVTITFNDPAMAPTTGSVKSLIDGLYQLTIVANQIKSSANGQFLDGDGNGTGGDNASVSFHRLFGDVRGSSTTDFNGNGFTDNVDLVQFRAANGSDSTQVNYDEALDYNGDGFIDNLDLLEFRGRIGSQP